MNVNDILDALVGLDETDLYRVNQAAVDEIKAGRKRASRRAIAQLTEGDEVRIVPGKLASDSWDDRTTEVVKVNRTRVVVKHPTSPWKDVSVPANALEKVA